jgi:Protein of unknown function (DUF1549)/Protein of unknown function (DUF1553)
MMTRTTKKGGRGAILLWLSLALLAGPSWLLADSPSKDVADVDGQIRSRVDALLKAAWKDASVKPAPRATDAEFLRRAYLDLTGRIPRVSEARSFLDDPASDKRTRLIDTLLASPGYPSHLADVWRQILLTDTAAVDDAGTSDGFENWLRNAFAENRSYAEIARELILATGQPTDSGPALFYTALELKPEKLAASTSRAFLGIQIQCAECHNHPFDKWTKRDFWGYAAFFARVSQQQGGRAMMANSYVRDRETGDVTLPNSREVVPARFLLGSVAKDTSNRTRRMLLAEWMTSPSNHYFARAAVNRVWAQLFGRGIVDPPDDLRDDQPARTTELLGELSDYFVHSNYDIRRLYRVLATTEAYQLASEEASGQRPPELFAAMPLKVLTAEQLYTCVSLATCRPYDKILASVPSSGARRAMTNRAGFVNSFRAPSTGPTEYLAGIPQALKLLNGRLVDDATDVERSDILTALDVPFLTDRERVETLFLATLSRRPSPEVGQKFEAYVAKHSEPAARRRALGNILWALLNSAEFAVNH